MGLVPIIREEPLILRHSYPNSENVSYTGTCTSASLFKEKEEPISGGDFGGTDAGGLDQGRYYWN